MTLRGWVVIRMKTALLSLLATMDSVQWPGGLPARGFSASGSPTVWQGG